MTRAFSTALLVLALSPSASLALDVDRDTVQVRAVEPPRVNVAEIDLVSVRADLAFGRVAVGEPTLRTTKTWCVPRGSDNAIRDAVEMLRFLDLSGNNIARLPDSIGKLRNLETLKLKGNPLAEGGVERLKSLLPGCKIKS